MTRLFPKLHMSIRPIELGTKQRRENGPGSLRFSIYSQSESVVQPVAVIESGQISLANRTSGASEHGELGILSRLVSYFPKGFTYDAYQLRCTVCELRRTLLGESSLVVFLICKDLSFNTCFVYAYSNFEPVPQSNVLYQSSFCQSYSTIRMRSGMSASIHCHYRFFSKNDT